MSDKPKCEKCGDTGFLDCAEPIFCDCGFGLEVAIASAGRSVRERVREAFADLRAHIAALEAAAPTPDDAKVLADIRAAKVLPTFNEIQVLKELRERIQHPLATCHTVQRTNDWQWLSDHEIMVSIILAPPPPEPKPCPLCGKPSEVAPSCSRYLRCPNPACELFHVQIPRSIYNRLTLTPKEVDRG